MRYVKALTPFALPTLPPALPAPPVPQFKARPIQHPLFKNMSMQDAAADLSAPGVPVGQCVIRPSARGPGLLNITMSMPESIWHIDIEEGGKVGGWGVRGGEGGRGQPAGTLVALLLLFSSARQRWIGRCHVSVPSPPPSSRPAPQTPGSLKLGSSLSIQWTPGEKGKKEVYEDLDEARQKAGLFLLALPI